MYRVFYLFLVMSAIAVTHAQLTFSTGWGNGKRSVRSDQDGCSSEDSIYAIFKLIQREAEKFLACQSEGKN